MVELEDSSRSACCGGSILTPTLGTPVALVRLEARTPRPRCRATVDRIQREPKDGWGLDIPSYCREDRLAPAPLGYLAGRRVEGQKT